MMEYITVTTLQKWDACEDGVACFIEHFEKATLKDIADKCMELKEDSYAIWLFEKCMELKLFEETTSKGYGNSGDRNSGHRNSGDRNSGDRNSGNWNSGDRNSGFGNSGDRNSGGRNSGDRNSGFGNSGNWNSGGRNSGFGNSGHGNSGDRNSGGSNSGFCNSGHGNSGNWNSASHESGFFNSKQDKYVRVFNKQVNREDWENAKKPKFIYNLKLCYWVNESEMTDEEKKSDPNCYVRGGQLRNRSYKEAWRVAYDNASPEDIKLLKDLPGFDADVFEEITGIRV